MFRLGRMLLAGGSLLCGFVAGRATTVNPPEFADLVNQSDYIVRAVVKSVDAKREQTAQGNIIYTYVELDVSEAIAGKPPSPLVLRILGGRVGKKEMILEGAPQFKVGDEDILFVQGNGRQIYPLVAIMHGRYPIQREKDTGREFVARSNQAPLHSIAEVARPIVENGAAQAPALMKSPASALTPSQFVQQIRAAVKSSNHRLLEH
jgi:hypothetical protein